MPQVDPDLWRQIMAYLRKHHPAICRHWFNDLAPLALQGGVLIIGTDGPVQQRYLQSQCREPFTEAAQDRTGALVGVRFVSGADVALEQYADEEEDSTDAVVISPDYSFDNFVSGANNRLAYAASIAVANNPGVSYNPLFIHGGVGLGKTHLLQAITQAILENDNQKRILYLSCDAFVNQFLDCVQRGQMSQFRHRYRDLDLLVIDDIHFLTGKEQTQEEFFHTFNALHQSKRQIVLSSDSPPAEIPQLEDRLVSRFQSGLVAHISPPTYETRIAILRSKAQMRSLEIPEEVIHFIARHIDSNARELEGAITTLQGHANLEERRIDLALAREVLGDSGFDTASGQMTLNQIVEVVTSHFGVKLSDMQSKKKHKSISEPRQLCMWLARHHTRFTYKEIGGHFGGRDHSTVMSAIQVVDRRRATDPAYQKTIEAIQSRLLSRAG